MKFFLGITIAIVILVSQGSLKQKRNQKMKPNNVTWFSIPTNDLNKATRFYNEVFHWRIEPLTHETNSDYSFHIAVTAESDEDYISKKSGSVNGCIVKKQIGLPTPAVLIEVEDLEEALNKVKAAGGKVMTEPVIMESLNGTFALIQDLDGNYVEIFQNLSPSN